MGASHSRFLRFTSALRRRNYRLLWTGTLVSNTGDWLDMVALNWLIVAQNGGALDLAVVNFCRAIPILALALVGGAIADRVKRRSLLIVIQLASMALAVILTVLAVAGVTPLWALAMIAAGRGAAFAFNLPARHALIPMLVPRDELPNAVALNLVTLNATKVLGPMLAGLMIAQFGLTVCFAMNAVSYLAVLYTLYRMTLPPAPQTQETPEPRESLAAAILSGLRYVIARQVLYMLVLVALVPVFLGQPFLVLLAVFAHDALHWGPTGFGLLTSAAGLGSVLGALVIGGYTQLLRRGIVMLVLLLAFGLSLLAFAANPVAVLAPLILIVSGATYMSYNTALTSIMQMTIEDAYRGRVMSMMFMNRGLMPLGTAAAATLSASAGVRVAYGVMGGLILIFTLALLVFVPKLRRLQT